MARKVRLRQKRIYELRILIVFVLFIAVLFSGLLAVDINKSYMLYGEPRLELLQIEQFDTDRYRIIILNSNFTLNLKYIKRDINKLKSFFM